jgi:hypothetical protein
VFLYHIGKVLFHAQEKSLPFKVKRVHTGFRVMRTPTLNPELISEGLLLRFMCKSKRRNEKIADTLIDAAKAGRKILVLSTRLNHLELLKTAVEERWPDGSGELPVMDYYVGGRKEKELDAAEAAKIIFATAQMCKEALDIPPLDTLFLVVPLGDIEQALGRIRRPFDGKKDPICVDFREDAVPLCKKLAGYRDKQYERIAA